MSDMKGLKRAFETAARGVSLVKLDAERLGDPEYENGKGVEARLVFYGPAADYVAEMLDEARSVRVRQALVREYTTMFASSSMPARDLEKILSEFALRLLDSSAVRVFR